MRKRKARVWSVVGIGYVTLCIGVTKRQAERMSNGKPATPVKWTESKEAAI